MKRFLVPLSQSDQSDIESVTSKKNRNSSTTISVIDRDVQNSIFEISQNVENGPNNPTLRSRDETLVENRDHLIFCGIQNTNG